jgi:hypothetical protein
VRAKGDLGVFGWQMSTREMLGNRRLRGGRMLRNAAITLLAAFWSVARRHNFLLQILLRFFTLPALSVSPLDRAGPIPGKATPWAEFEIPSIMYRCAATVTWEVDLVSLVSAGAAAEILQRCSFFLCCLFILLPMFLLYTLLFPFLAILLARTYS